MQNKLLPCPFCGGEAEIRELVDRDIHGYNIGVRYMVGCIDDDGQCCMNIETSAYRKKEEAIEHWNTRKPMERIVEQLEEKINTIENEPWRDYEEREIEKSTYYDAIEIVKGGVEDAE